MQFARLYGSISSVAESLEFESTHSTRIRRDLLGLRGRQRRRVWLRVSNRAFGFRILVSGFWLLVSNPNSGSGSRSCLAQLGFELELDTRALKSVESRWLSRLECKLLALARRPSLRQVGLSIDEPTE